MSGAALTTYVLVLAKDLKVSRGKNELVSYAVTDRMTQHFCSTCGTSLFNVNANLQEGLAMLRLGILDAQEELVPRLEIFCQDQLLWVPPVKGATRFEGPFQRAS